MERFCPENHVSLAYARNFERLHHVTQELGLGGDSFDELTGLYLADHTLTIVRRSITGDRGRQFWEKVMPGYIYSRMYPFVSQELPLNLEAGKYVEERIQAINEPLSPEDKFYSRVLSKAVTNLLDREIIKTKGYELLITEENIGKISSERIERIPPF